MLASGNNHIARLNPFYNCNLISARFTYSNKSLSSSKNRLPFLVFTSLFYNKSNFTVRSEEHTSELQSLMRISYAVFCLKKKINTTDTHKKNYTILQKSSILSIYD